VSRCEFRSPGAGQPMPPKWYGHPVPADVYCLLRSYAERLMCHDDHTI
jgi:hypothetical protein